jgi:mono/diheme cytochrome c family protein
MKSGFVAVATAVVAFGFASGAYAEDGKLIAKGEQVYAAQKCSMCHSVGDKGNKKGPLDGVGTKLTAAEIREWMLNPAEMHKKTGKDRKPNMKPYDKVPKEDLDALVAYMQSLKK